MAPGATGVVPAVEDDELVPGAAEVVGDGQVRLTASDHNDVMVGLAHAVRFRGATAIVDRSVAG